MSDLIASAIAVCLWILAIAVCLWILAIGGYIANIVKLVMMVDGGVTAMFIARCVGVFFGPLGIVLGFV